MEDNFKHKGRRRILASELREKGIQDDRILKARKTDKGCKISIEWYGWLMEKELPSCEVTDAILEEFED